MYEVQGPALKQEPAVSSSRRSCPQLSEGRGPTQDLDSRLRGNDTSGRRLGAALGDRAALILQVTYAKAINPAHLTDGLRRRARREMRGRRELWLSDAVSEGGARGGGEPVAEAHQRATEGAVSLVPISSATSIAVR
jgi:hypothetical protein